MQHSDEGSVGSSVASEGPLSLKVVVIGDPGCGKTSMVTAYTHTEMPQGDQIKPFEIHSKTCELASEEVHVGMWDASGVEAFDRIRPLSYMQTDVFMLCFSIVQPTSFDNVREKWSREAQFHTGDVPFVLVGIMADMRDNEAVISELAEGNTSPVSLEDGQALADEIGAMKYIEVSSLTRSGLEDAIDKVLARVVDDILHESHHEDDGAHLPRIGENTEGEEPQASELEAGEASSSRAPGGSDEHVETVEDDTADRQQSEQHEQSAPPSDEAPADTAHQQEDTRVESKVPEEQPSSQPPAPSQPEKVDKKPVAPPPAAAAATAATAAAQQHKPPPQPQQAPTATAKKGAAPTTQQQQQPSSCCVVM